MQEEGLQLRIAHLRVGFTENSDQPARIPSFLENIFLEMYVYSFNLAVAMDRPLGKLLKS